MDSHKPPGWARRDLFYGTAAAGLAVLAPRLVRGAEYGCALPPIDFVAFARACGADGFHCERPDEVRPAIESALRSPRAALVEAVVDADEKPTKPDELKA
jgi:thiamine pyrophosphate-dependent acetolactate synthase large subunit-like protein